MRHAVLQHLIAWLLSAALLVQCVTFGLPSGLSLCLGCEGGPWTVGYGCAPVEHDSCCGGAHEDEPASPAVLDISGDCPCIDVPLVGGQGLVTARTDTGSDARPIALDTSPVAVIFVALDAESIWRARGLGGAPPPRLSTPLALRTMLLV